jgi:hypothetical protein
VLFCITLEVQKSVARKCIHLPLWISCFQTQTLVLLVERIFASSKDVVGDVDRFDEQLQFLPSDISRDPCTFDWNFH